MYSPTTRLLTVLELLQAQAGIKGTELARRLEVDGRTVRRYIERLQEMGIPVEAERGPAGAYRLRRGFKLPPMMFTDGEALALTLGLMAVRRQHLPFEQAAIEGALAKIERVLPEGLHAQARALQEAISFHVGRPPVPTDPACVTALSESVWQRRRVRMRYATWHGQASERDFDPYGIVVTEGHWYVAGFCHLRGDLRTFRLDRIQALSPVEAGFERPAGFDAVAHVLHGLTMGPDIEPVEVLMRAPIEVVQPLLSYCLGTLESVPEGVIFRRGPYHLEWVARFLLGLTFPCEVRATPALREMIRAQASAGLRMIGDSV